MVSTSFSLTETAIIKIWDLDFQSPSDNLWEGAKSELITRVIAVFTSFTAAIDVLVHTTVGLLKGVCVILGIHDHKSIAYKHIKRAAWFALLMTVGSIVGAIWPKVFNQYGAILEGKDFESCFEARHAGQTLKVPVGKPFAIKLADSNMGHFPLKLSTKPRFIRLSEKYTVKHHNHPLWCGVGSSSVFVFHPGNIGKGEIIFDEYTRSEPKSFTIISEG